MVYQKTAYRYLLFLVSSILLQLEANTSITDRAGITRVTVAKIVKPTTLQELRDIVQNSQDPLSIAGGRFSQGGQIAYPHGTVIDMSALNRILSFDKRNKRITVQTGATWNSIQEFIDPHNLSIKIMQSYNDFSVGGSLSVNVHARDIHCGSLIGSVESITVLLADGRLLKASRSEYSDLFYAAIGGYGLLGVIVDATLTLTDNPRITKKVQLINARHYPQIFRQILQDPQVVFQNADIFPMEFKKALSITWSKTNEETTMSDRLQYTGFFNRLFKKVSEILIRRIPFLKKVRPTFDAKSGQEKIVVMRNYEMSYSTDQLALSPNLPTRMTLQEYFVPLNRYQEAVDIFTKFFSRHTINVVNLSVRYVPHDHEALLSYAPQDSFAFVFYINFFDLKGSTLSIQTWTQELIDLIIPLGGTFYMPYILGARKDQVMKAYPNYKKFLEIKKKYDPRGIFRNMLSKKYFD